MKKTPSDIQAMFDDIAPTYDVLNHLLSFGLDRVWRRKAMSLLEEKKDGVILDIASGSGDLSLEALSLSPRRIVSADFAENMLSVFRKKLRNMRQKEIFDLVSCDALCLPFRNESFDALTVAFGMRNFADRFASLAEMRRILKPTGLAMILELSRPDGPVVSRIYDLYARSVLPFLGRVISRHLSAYRYLPDSIAEFPPRDKFLGLMQAAGFAETRTYLLTFGAATIYVGRKREQPETGKS